MVHEVENTISKHDNSNQPNTNLLTRITISFTGCLIAACMGIIWACTTDNKPNAPAVSENDSFPFMQSWGVSTLISDSGVIRYKIVAEEWNIYNSTNPPKWTFVKGLFLEKFDSTFHIDWFVQCDTAYCYNQNLWELRGRVFIRNMEGTEFSSEELFWDMDRHEMYSNLFMTIRTPEKLLQGYNFRSNEQMTCYHIQNSNAEMPFGGDSSSELPQDSTSIQRSAPTKMH